MAISSRRALIIGGGVAGPVLALFLKQAGFDPQVFEASDGPNDAGGALGLASNGMNVLAAAGVVELVRDRSVTTSDWAFENQTGRVLARSRASDPALYGEAGVMITRSALHQVLMSEAEAAGIQIHYNKTLTDIVDRTDTPIVARFSDGGSAEGDLLIGADGIRSQVRQAIMPEAPRPVYTGMMAPGGFSPCLDLNVTPRSNQRVHFIFGQKGFFGYFNTMASHGPCTVWWSTTAAALESKEAMAATTFADLQKRLLEVHGGWMDPVPQLIGAATNIMNAAIHDVPSLPSWSAGRCVLIGDAAHAVAPHSGQGASMALEDAMYLAKLLRESMGKDLGTVFAQFEQHRRPRTDKVIALGRRNGQRKQVMSAAEYWIQQQMIRIFVPLTRSKRQDWLLGYKVA
jgi:2-polyprenyl-6-methoxyphenol hydroxylase-like FAD-dependent oxidoreductase